MDGEGEQAQATSPNGDTPVGPQSNPNPSPPVETNEPPKEQGVNSLDSPANSDSDEDPDLSSSDDLMDELTYSRHRRPQNQASGYWRKQSDRNAYSWRNPQFIHPSPASDELDESSFPQLVRNQLYGTAEQSDFPSRFYSHQYHQSSPYPTAKRYNTRIRSRFDGPPLMASVDHGQDPTNSLGLDSTDESLAGYPTDDSFNSIHANSANNLRRTHQILRQHQLASMGQRPRQQPNRVLSVPTSSEAAHQASCGECYRTVKRLSSRQFCHLDYALRASILSKTTRDDWTRIEVKVLDVFKSPASKQQLDQTSVSSASNYIDNALSIKNKTFDAELQASSSNQNLGHRIKLNTIQHIWVPTEDLSCRCLRLRLDSTYLLLGKLESTEGYQFHKFVPLIQLEFLDFLNFTGSLDSRDDSAFTLQLDRHGIAMEWKPSLQEKLIKYQRRQARGRC